jgi:hypothetical protein
VCYPNADYQTHKHKADPKDAVSTTNQIHSQLAQQSSVDAHAMAPIGHDDSIATIQHVEVQGMLRVLDPMH